MKRLSLALFSLFSLCYCGSNEGKPAGEGSANKAPQATERKLTAEEDRGETLIAQNDCLGCHKVDEKLQGPSYREVAAKYASAPAGITDTLAQRIIKGHVGVWGDLPMTAHPNLSETDAKAMVAYVLSLKQ